MPAITNHIPNEVRDLLSDSRYGISFPSASGCQMRFIEKGENYGGFYSYRQWGGVRPAVVAAISRNQQLRALYGRNKTGRPRIRQRVEASSNTGVLGVYKNTYLDKRRGLTYIRYMASWAEHGKPKIRGFHLVANASADQHFHALRTAIAFRQAWEKDGDSFDPTRFSLWKSKRLYEYGDPELPAGFWD